MSISSEVMQQVLSLPPHERFELAQQLLDSIDDSAAAGLDNQLLEELRRRREEMLQGEQIVTDWRGALSAIDASFSN